MEGPPKGPGGEDITYPDQVTPRGRKASSTRKIKPQTSNLTCGPYPLGGARGRGVLEGQLDPGTDGVSGPLRMVGAGLRRQGRVLLPV